LRTALWFSSFGIPRTGLLLPYTAQSPTLFKRIEFKNEKDIENEIDRILSEPNIKKHGIGQSLYFQLPFFCNPDEQIPNWCWQMIDDYYVVTEYNIPLSNTLDDANAWVLDCFNIIKDEVNKINIYKAKNGN
jgi:hypothetical protein|tara:strand:+ start:458 stop:853 length:396 start_codon:yes stop_codon:yes gene_type:complete